MLRNGENRKILNLESVLIILVIFLGFLIFRTSQDNNNSRSKTSTHYFSASESCAVINTFEGVQKTWILNNDNSNIPVFTRNVLMEGRNAELEINSLLRKTQQFTPICRIMLHRLSIIPEPDEPLDLS